MQKIQELLLEVEVMHANALFGTTTKILVEREAHRGGGDMAGRTENNRVVNFQGDSSLVGQFVDVRIDEAHSNSLRGELLTDSVTA
jgi:tRNA-2-methylthio-N6-dimethylallyladenosine synthase